MSVDRNLLNIVLGLTTKEAYAPPGPAPMDPAAMGGGMPMDPAMMGGMPPMDPAMMGGAPPMDPAMMGGGMPMDPSMMGGMPPMDPAAMGMDPSMMGGAPGAGAPPEGAPVEGTPVMLTMEDLQAIMAEAAGGAEAGAEEGSKRATNKDIMETLEQQQMMIAHLANFLGVPLPEGGVGVPMEQGELPPMPEEAPDMGTDPFTAPAEAAAGPAAGMPDPTGGMLGAPSDAAMFPPESVKTASAQKPVSFEQARDESRRQLLMQIERLNKYT